MVEQFLQQQADDALEAVKQADERLTTAAHEGTHGEMAFARDVFDGALRTYRQAVVDNANHIFAQVNPDLPTAEGHDGE